MIIRLSSSFRIESDQASWNLVETRISQPTEKHPEGSRKEHTTYHATVKQAVRFWVEKALSKEPDGTAQHLIAAIERLHARIEEIPEFRRPPEVEE